MTKGAVLKKGERLRSRFCKFSKGECRSIRTGIETDDKVDQVQQTVSSLPFSTPPIPRRCTGPYTSLSTREHD